MEIKVYAVVHVEAGIVHDVRPFTEWDEAKAYRDELVQSFKPEGWDDVEDGKYTFLDYSEGSGTLHIQETLLSLPDRPDPYCLPDTSDKSGGSGKQAQVTPEEHEKALYDDSVEKLRIAGESLYKQHGELILFIREYFSRYDIELPCLEGVQFVESLTNGNLCQILRLASDIMLSTSGIQGILDTNYGR